MAKTCPTCGAQQCGGHPPVAGAEHGEPDTVRDAYDRMIRDRRAG